MSATTKTFKHARYLWNDAKALELAGDEVGIKVDWDTSTYNVIADPCTEKQNIKIKTSKAGGSYNFIIQGTNKIIMEDVIIGEV